MPPPPQIPKIIWKTAKRKVSALFYINKSTANCLNFFEVSGFLYIKTSRFKKCHPFCIYMNSNFKKFMKNSVT